jgi:hypothetical protein
VASLQSKLFPAGLGGGLLGFSVVSVHLRDSNLTSNAAQLSGGGIHLEEAVLNMDGCLLQDNEVGASGNKSQPVLAGPLFKLLRLFSVCKVLSLSSEGV